MLPFQVQPLFRRVQFDYSGGVWGLRDDKWSVVVPREDFNRHTASILEAFPACIARPGVFDDNSLLKPRFTAFFRR